MRRIACIALPRIRVEIAQEREGRTRRREDGKGLRIGADTPQILPAFPPSCSIPLAIVVARPGGSVRGPRDVLGSTRIDVVSREARAAGVRAGQTVAAARARCSELRVRVVAEEAVRAALARVAEAALALGPAAAFDVAQDVVWLDVTGCAHLHGGEQALARALDARVRALGHECRVVVADGPRIAAAVARFAPRRGNEPVLVPAGRGAQAVRALPIAALALDDDVARWLVDLGLGTCGDLQKLPRRSLGTRLGARAHDVMLLLDGEDRAPLDVWRPPEVPEERLELEWGAHSLESLASVLETLCDRLAARLAGRAMAATRLELTLMLDAALLRFDHAPAPPGACRREDETAARRSFDIVLPAPVARAADLLAVVRARLERLSGSGVAGGDETETAPGRALAAPVMAVALRVPELARPGSRTLDLLSPEPAAEHALPRLAAELAAELGPSRVGTLALVDTWAPDERTRLVPFGAPAEILAGGRRTARPEPLHARTSTCLEPTRLVAAAPIARAALGGVVPLVRLEAAEWWRREGGGASDRRPRDWVAAWIAPRARDGGGGGAHGWIALNEEEPLLRGWID
jgi:protein ImuB